MKTLILGLILFASVSARSQAVIAYYAGNPDKLDSFEVEKLTHIIFSFCHLKGDRLHVANRGDSAAIKKMVSLKKRNRKLKVLLSLGGWGGCEKCSEVFSTSTGRTNFANSVKNLSKYFHTDGIDLDWEYPTIPGYPGHRYDSSDRKNFTALIVELRSVLGHKQTISFAAGGFDQYLQQAVDWKSIMPIVDMVNLMSYDLVNGNSVVTGHHTPLYSTEQNPESIDHAIHFFDSAQIPLAKIIIGAAFYGRVWGNVANVNHGLYQSGKFLRSVNYKDIKNSYFRDTSYALFRDPVAHAPYLYNESAKQFVTFDDETSIAAKTQYVVDKKLGGIMFWQLASDTYHDGLLDTIFKTLRANR